MASPSPGVGAEASAHEVDEPAVGEYAAHEAELQDAVSDVLTSKDGFGLHGTAKRIMDQLDELCHEEVRGGRFQSVPAHFGRFSLG